MIQACEKKEWILNLDQDLAKKKNKKKQQHIGKGDISSLSGTKIEKKNVI